MGCVWDRKGTREGSRRHANGISEEDLRDARAPQDVGEGVAIDEAARSAVQQVKGDKQARQAGVADRVGHVDPLAVEHLRTTRRRGSRAARLPVEHQHRASPPIPPHPIGWSPCT